MNVIFKIKHFIGNVFHIKKWSDNYERNRSNESLFDAYMYVTTIHKSLYEQLDNYYKSKNIIIPLKKHKVNLSLKIVETTIPELVPYKMMSYDKESNTIFVYPKILYINPIEFRGILVHEIVHHVYRDIQLTYSEFKPIFKFYGIGEYEQDPEEFIADYWRLYYEGYNKSSIIDILTKWYFKKDKKDITKNLINRLQICGYIPT